MFSVPEKINQSIKKLINLSNLFTVSKIKKMNNKYIKAVKLTYSSEAS